MDDSGDLLAAETSTVGDATMANYEAELLDETQKIEPITEEKSSDYDDGEVTFKLPKSVSSSEELPKPELNEEEPVKRDRDEKLVDRLQKKLTDPTSPSNSPMVKKLKPEEKEAEEEPLPARGAYKMDFDKFDDPDFNPFETKAKVTNVESDAPVKSSTLPSTEAPVDVTIDKEPPMETTIDKGTVEESEDLNQLNNTFDAPKRKPPQLGKNRKPIKKKAPPKAKPIPPPAPPAEELEDTPLPAKGAYDIDYSKFDDPNFNPFETKSKVVNNEEDAPLPAKGAYNVDFDKFDDPNFNPFETKAKVTNVESSAPVKPSTPPPAEAPLDATVDIEPPIDTTVDKGTTEDSEDLNQLNNTFDAPKRKPPTLGKNRKPIKKKLPPKAKPTPPPKEEVVEDAPLPVKGAYNIDYDKFDDPDFNPFETKSKVENKMMQDDEAPLPAKGGYNMDFDKFDDPNFNPFETKSKVTNQDEPLTKPKSSGYDLDKFDDPNFNPFETKAKVKNVEEKLEDTSPVQLDKTQTKKEHVSNLETNDKTVPNLNMSAESEQFHSASENENSFGDENHDPNTDDVIKSDDPVARAKAKLAQRQEEEKAKSKAEASLSHVGTLVEHVQGDTLRYTSRDMEIIRRQARIQAEGNKGEVADLCHLLSHYETVIDHMKEETAEKVNQMAKEVASAMDDRDALQDDMKSLDRGYHDLQARYFRLRTAIEDMRSNEQRLKDMCKQYEQRVINEQERYRILNESSKKELRKASDELDTIEERKDKEVQRKDAEIRICKSRVAALQSQLDQKTAENEELVAICDQLMEGK